MCNFLNTHKRRVFYGEECNKDVMLVVNNEIVITETAPVIESGRTLALLRVIMEDFLESLCTQPH